MVVEGALGDCGAGTRRKAQVRAMKVLRQLSPEGLLPTPPVKDQRQLMGLFREGRAGLRLESSF
jgi:hypothetical protein